MNTKKIIKTTVVYLDELLSVYPQVKNDSQLAQLIGVKRQTVSQYRHGHNMSVLVAVRVARLLQRDPMETIAATMAEQCRAEDERQFWEAEYEAAAVLP